ncbi:hypothetical protein [Actinoplanes subglobosus]|uniref:Uncharacterized protein n=1 Tax=Actinoplanes subglobosus TaxID=1547892 RepID=A0ABV8IRC5_9ACTN
MPDTQTAPNSWLEAAEQIASRTDVLTALVAGDRTKQQLAARLGITLDPVLGISLVLDTLLTSLLCDGLLFMRVVDRQWHHLPSKKGRALVAQQAGTAVPAR